MNASMILISLMVGSAVVLILVEEWRLSLTALGALSLVVSVLLGAETLVLMGFVQLLVSAISLLIWFFTLQALPGSVPSVQYAFGMPYRVITAIFALAIAFSLADTHPFSDLPPALNFATYWLGTLGLFMLVLARRVLAVGFALVMIESVGHVLLTVFNQGPGLTRLLLASFSQIAISLAIAFLLVLEQSKEPSPQ